jgi:hypothetical protein
LVSILSESLRSDASMNSITCADDEIMNDATDAKMSYDEFDV